jgi:uncharacterized membrane protein YqaE (UPF0057 family)
MPKKSWGRFVFELICMILFPPAAVWSSQGVNFHLAISILLTIFGFVGGVLHALYVVLILDEARNPTFEELAAEHKSKREEKDG